MKIQKIYTNLDAKNYAYSINNINYDSQKIRTGYDSYDSVSFHSKKGRKAIQSAKAIAKAIAEKAKMLLDSTINEVTNKELDKNGRIWGISLNNSISVHKTILKPQKYVNGFMHDLLDDLVVSEKNPKNFILKISDREKKEVSIMEKSATNKWNSIQEVIDNMTDLNGAKIVMNKKTDKSNVDYVLDRLIPMITSGQAELIEIEVKRPKAVKNLSLKEQEQYDYASTKMLQKLVEVQEGKWNSKNTTIENIRTVKYDSKKPQYTKGNYCALHMLINLPNKTERPFELQLIGARMGEGKDLDDILFKFFDGKQVDKKYNRIINILQTLNDENNIAAKERFMQYRRDALLALRDKEIQESNSKKTTIKNGQLFISAAKYSLTPEYDLNNLLELKNECDKNAKICARNLEEARKVKKEKIEKLNQQKEKRKNRPLFPEKMLNKLFFDYSFGKQS